MKHEEIQELLSDYVLGLLPAAEERQVRSHVASCSACRQTVQQERRIGSWVTEAMNGAMQAEAPRLRAFMPDIPVARRPVKISRGWTAQLVPLTAVLLLAIGFLLQLSPNQPALPAMLRSTSTATMTFTPTATIAQDTIATTSATEGATTVAANVLYSPKSIATPSAPLTPVAANFSKNVN